MIPEEKLIRQIDGCIDKAFEKGFFEQKDAAIFGCNSNVVSIKEALADRGINTVGLIDNDVRKQGKIHNGLCIYSPQKFLEKYSNTVIIICSAYSGEMSRQLKELGFDAEARLLIIPNIAVDFRGKESIVEAEEKVRNGYRAYQALLDKTDNAQLLFVFPYKGTGDVYVACTFLGTYIQKKGIGKYVLCVVNENCRKVAELFGYGEVYVTDKDTMQDILSAWVFLGSDVMRMKPLIHWGWRGKNTPYIFDNDNLSFVDMYRYDVFGLSDKDMPVHPAFKRDKEYAGKYLKQHGLQEGKTIIFAPYANSFKADIGMELWVRISDELKRRGYSVATNCYGSEKPLEGTVPVSFSYEHAIEILECAGGFVALRSGLCDIVSQADCKMVIVYEDNARSTSYSHFGLKKMGFHIKEYPIKYEIPSDLEYIWEVFQ